MLSAFRSVRCTSIVPASYMPNETAECQGPSLQKQLNTSINLALPFLEARLPVCLDESKGCPLLDKGSKLILSPGCGIPRLYYSAVASAIASNGFTVIAIDHPDEINIITYPDGRTVYGPGPSSLRPVGAPSRGRRILCYRPV